MKIMKSRIQAFVEGVMAITPECRLWLKSSQAETRCVDTANVAMVEAILPKTAFEEFTDTTGPLGIDLMKLKTAIALMDDVALDIQANPQSSKINVTDGNRKYSNTLLDINTIRKDPNPPTIQLPASIRVDATRVWKGVDACSKIGDKIGFSLHNNTLTLESEGNTDQIVEPIPGEALQTQPAAVFSLFSKEYVHDICKVTKDAGTVTVSLNNRHPLRIECVLDEVQLRYLIAPRIEVD